MGIRTTRNQMAEDFIRRKIANLNAGEALPPLRRMIEESGFGRKLLENALRKLASGRVLESRARSGIYLADSAADSAGCIDLVACSEIAYLDPADPDMFALELTNQLLAGAARRNLVPRLHRVSLAAPVHEYEKLAERYRMCNAFLLMPHHGDIPRIFETQGVAQVTVLPRYYPNTGPAVIDAPQLVEMQLDCLFRHGHRRIGFIDTVDLGLAGITDLLRRESYYRVMCEHALPVRPEWVIHYSLERERLFERFDHMFASDWAPTALVVSDWFVKPVYQYLTGRGWMPGREVSVISCDGLHLSGLKPKPVTVLNSPAKIAALAWELWEKRKADPEFSTIDCIELGIQDGDSVATVGMEVQGNADALEVN